MKQLTLQISDHVYARLEKIAEESDADDVVEVMRRALAVYECCHNIKMSGGKVLGTLPTGRNSPYEIEIR